MIRSHKWVSRYGAGAGAFGAAAEAVDAEGLDPQHAKCKTKQHNRYVYADMSEVYARRQVHRTNTTVQQHIFKPTHKLLRIYNDSFARF